MKRYRFGWKKYRAIWNKTEGHCYYCKTFMPYETDPDSPVMTRGWHVDHMVPVARGGHVSDMNNLVPACAACNLAKGTMTAEEFMAVRNV